jgi:S-DNA-T family DNA segregation ATPase FtsK/SpoIIIE
MPHLLVAGATGQGKSVGLNVMLMSLLHKKTPEELKLVLIDPKKVELSVYSKLAGSYLAHPVITEVEEAQNVLTALCNIMDERYDLVSSAGKRNIKEYNSLSIVEPLPYIVVVIDEYGDLVMQAGREMERAICRLAQKARAVGIHLIISTQRPSATVVTGNIKANFPVRIAFRTTTGTDSRVVLDQTGAEKLTGRGDMIYFAGAETTRVQCAYTGIDEVLQTVSDIADSYNEYEAKEIIKIEQYTSVQTEDDRIEQYKKAIQGLGYSREDRDKKDYLFAKIVNGIDLKAWREME